MGLFDRTRKLASLWASSKVQQLQAQVESPESWVAGGGQTDQERFTDRRAKRDELEQYHDIRVDGGVVATLLEARALMVFGPGGQFTSEDDEVADFLNDAWNDRDMDLVDIGTDSYFYGYSLGEISETRAGDFAGLTLIEPWTTVPKKNRKGEIEEWEQKISEGSREFTQEFDPDDIVHFKTMKASGRDGVGMSLLGRAMDETETYRDNQRAIKNAIQLQGYPKFHVKLGREGGAVIDDNELRRARPMFDNVHEMTKWITGQDVDIDVIEAENFDFEGITEHDLSKLAIAFMLPIELTQIGGGDGLGTGFPAKLRRQLFLLGARAHQRLLGDQLVQQVGRPLLEDYAPEGLAAQAEEVGLEFQFNDPITDIDELDSMVAAIGDDMTVNERRDLFDLPPLDDDEVGEQFDQPGETDPGSDGGLFNADGDGDADSTHALADSHEDAWMQLYQETLWADDAETNLLSFSESQVPQFVRDRLREAILSGALFSDFADIPSGELMDLRLEFAETLTDEGWTITELTDRIQDLQPQLDRDEAERIARTETQSTVTKARELGYRERDDFEELRFDWAGPSDGRTSEVCAEIKSRVPDEGLAWDDLLSLTEEVAREFADEDQQVRPRTPHINCRHAPVRVVN